VRIVFVPVNEDEALGVMASTACRGLCPLVGISGMGFDHASVWDANWGSLLDGALSVFELARAVDHQLPHIESRFWCIDRRVRSPAPGASSTALVISKSPEAIRQVLISSGQLSGDGLIGELSIEFSDSSEALRSSRPAAVVTDCDNCDDIKAYCHSGGYPLIHISGGSPTSTEFDGVFFFNGSECSSLYTAIFMARITYPRPPLGGASAFDCAASLGLTGDDCGDMYDMLFGPETGDLHTSLLSAPPGEAILSEGESDDNEAALQTRTPVRALRYMP